MEMKKVLIAVILSSMLLVGSFIYVGAAPGVTGHNVGSVGAVHPSYYLGSLVNIGGSNQDGAPYVAAASDGTLEATFVSYRWGTTPPQIAYTRSSDGGTNWSAVEQVSHSTGSAAPVGTASLVNVAGVTHLTYSTLSPGGGNASLYYTYRSSGTWSSTAVILPSQYANTAAQVGATSSGLYTLLFGDYNSKPQFSSSSDGGQTWAAVQNISAVSYGGHGYQLAQSGDNLYFTYADIFGDGTRTRGRYLAAGGWQAEESMASLGLRGAYSPAAAILSDTIVVAYCGWTVQNGDTHKDLYVTSRPIAQPDSWTTPAQLTQLAVGQDCNGTSLTLDPASGELLLAYQVTTTSGNQSFDNIYLSAGLPGSFSTPLLLTSFSGQESITGYQLLRTQAGPALALGYYNQASGVRRAYFAPLLADGAATPTPLPSATPGAATPTAGAATPTTPGWCVSPFSDIDGNPFYVEITWLYCQGIMQGVDATHFGPSIPANRAQFVVSLLRAYPIPLTTPASQTFSDVPSTSYAYQYIEAAYSFGLVSGYDRATCLSIGYAYPCFGQDHALSRAELARMIVYVTGQEQPTPSVPTFSDVPLDHWAYASIEAAYLAHLMNGVGGGRFEPAQLARRDELAYVIYSGLHQGYHLSIHHRLD